MNLVEGGGVGTVLLVLLDDFDGSSLDLFGLVGIAADVEHPAERLVGHDLIVDVDRRTVGATHLLADDLEGRDRHGVAELVDDHTVLHRGVEVLGLAIDHQHTLVVLAFVDGLVLHTFGKLGGAVNPFLLGLLAVARQVAQILGNQVDVAVGNVTHEEENLAGSVVETLAEDVVDLVERQRIDLFLGGQEDTTLVVGIGRLVELLQEGKLRVLRHKLNLVAQRVDVLVERLLVFARSVVVEIGQLEHRLEVFGRAVAREALREFADAGADGEVGAFQLLLQLGGVELGNTGIVDEAVGRLGSVGILVLIERDTTPAEGAHQDLVLLKVGFLDDKADTVGEGVLLVTQGGVVTGHLVVLHSGQLLGEEGLIFEIVDPRLGLDILGLVVDFQHLGLGGEAVAFLVGTCQIVDEIVVGDPLLDHCVDLFEGDFRDKLLGTLPLPTDAGDDFTFQIVVGVLLSQAVALGLVLLLGHLGVTADEFLFLTVELGLQKAVLVDAAHFGKHHARGIFDAVLLGSARANEGVAAATQESAVAGTGTHHGRGGLLTQLVEAVVEHAVDKLTDEALTVVADSALRGFRVFPEEHQAGGGSLLVGSDGDERLFVAGDIIGRTGLGVDGGGMFAEDFLHAGLHLVDTLGAAEVANDDHSLHIGTIPVVVEAHDVVTLETHDDALQTDGQTLGIARAFEHDGPGLVAQTLAGTLTATPLLVDDATLVLEFLRVEQQVASPTVEDVQTHLDHLRLVGRHVHVVDRLVERSPGVNLTTELDTVLLERVNHLVVGESLNAVESHVLAEVGKTALTLVLEDGAGVAHHTELDTVLGLAVVTDVVGETVGQLADAHLLVDGHGSFEIRFFSRLVAAGELGDSHAADKQEQQHCQKTFLHSG